MPAVRERLRGKDPLARAAVGVIERSRRRIRYSNDKSPSFPISVSTRPTASSGRGLRLPEQTVDQIGHDGLKPFCARAAGNCKSWDLQARWSNDCTDGCVYRVDAASLAVAQASAVSTPGHRLRRSIRSGSRFLDEDDATSPSHTDLWHLHVVRATSRRPSSLSLMSARAVR
jgi:hypothetical protein